MDWVYKNKVFDPSGKPEAYGFVYKLYYEPIDKRSYNGIPYVYYGKKALWSKETKPALKSGEVRDGFKRIHKNIKRKRTPLDVRMKESSWRTYDSSIKSDISHLELVQKEIIEFGMCEQAIGFMELREIINADFPYDEYLLNKNIAGKYYDNVYEAKGEWLKWKDK